jgi:hypothetical protein
MQKCQEKTRNKFERKNATRYAIDSEERVEEPWVNQYLKERHTKCKRLLLTPPIARACLIDLDAKQLFAKRGHIVEDVGVADIARLGLFAQHAHLAARERQQNGH